MKTTMKKILSVLLLVACLLSLVACGGTESAAVQTASAADGPVYKVGIVKYVDDASLDQIQQSICDRLDEVGKEMGVTFEYQPYLKNGQADQSTLNQIAADLIADGVDVIVPIATPAALVMQAATEENQIPVVFSAVSDPVGAGLVESGDAPGGNITGTSDGLNTEAFIDLMVAADPELHTLGILYDQGQDSSHAAVASARAYCQTKGITVVEKTGTTNDEISMAVDALLAAGVDAVFTPTDNSVMKAELAIYEKFIEAGVPHYGGADSFALNGAFCGYGVNYVTLGAATADMVVDILVNGADPGNTAVSLMSNGIATVNTEVAAALGMDYSVFTGMCEEVKELVTAESFE